MKVREYWFTGRYTTNSIRLWVCGNCNTWYYTRAKARKCCVEEQRAKIAMKKQTDLIECIQHNWSKLSDDHIHPQLISEEN